MSIDTKTTLSVKYEDADNNFTDYSFKASVFERDAFSIDLIAESSFLYIGYDKPLNAVYFNSKTPDYTEASMTLEYFNNQSWAKLEPSDDTVAFMRAGFVKWDRPTSQASHVIDGKKAYWYRFSVSETRTSLEFKGINLIFADDYELSLEQPYISSSEFLGLNSSHILSHVAARNEILQKLANLDYYKINTEGMRENINAWDLHVISEIKQAAVKLTLSKIYRNMSDDPNDAWDYKSKLYYKDYENALQLARLSLDINNDGKVDVAENKPQFQTRRLTR